MDAAHRLVYTKRIRTPRLSMSVRPAQENPVLCDKENVCRAQHVCVYDFLGVLIRVGDTDESQVKDCVRGPEDLSHRIDVPDITKGDFDFFHHGCRDVSETAAFRAGGVSQHRAGLAPAPTRRSTSALPIKPPAPVTTTVLSANRTTALSLLVETSAEVTTRTGPLTLSLSRGAAIRRFREEWVVLALVDGYQ